MWSNQQARFSISTSKSKQEQHLRSLLVEVSNSKDEINVTLALKKFDQEIKSLPPLECSKTFDCFIRIAPTLSGFTKEKLTGIYKSFIQHTFNAATPQQVLAGLGALVRVSLNQGCFAGIAQACDMTMNPVTSPIRALTKKEKKSDQAIIDEITDHTAIFLADVKEVELRDLKSSAPVQSPVMTKATLSTADKISAIKEWVKIFEKTTKTILRGDPHREDATAHPEKKDVTKPSNSVDNIELVGEATVFNTEEVLSMENWSKILNYFTSKLNFDFNDAEIVFEALKGNSISVIYFTELLKSKDPSELKLNPEKQKLIQRFFEKNREFSKDPQWTKHLFLKLYGTQLYTQPFNTNYFDALLAEFLKYAKPAEALTPLVTVIKEALARPHLLHDHFGAVCLALETAEVLIDENDLDPYTTTLIDGESFYAAMLSQWQRYHEPKLLEQPATWSPHHLVKGKKLQSYYRIKIPREDKLEFLTHVVILSELLPLLNQKNLFIQRMEQLFVRDIKEDKIIAILNSLIKNPDFKLADNEFSVLKHAVLHKLPDLKEININSANFDFLNAARILLNKKNVIVCENQFDEQRQQQVLKQCNKVDFSDENPELSGGVLFFKENNQLDLLIPVETIFNKFNRIEIGRRINLLQIRFYLAGFLRKLFNMADFQNKEIHRSFDMIPRLLCQLNDEARTVLMEQLFDEPMQENDKEIKQGDNRERKLVNPAKADAIFRIFAMFKPFKSETDKFDKVKQEIIKKYGAIYRSNAYFILFVNGVSPLFYETFKEKLAKQFILDNIKDENLLNLYKTYQAKSEAKNSNLDYEFICLLDYARRNSKLFDNKILQAIQKLNSNPACAKNQDLIFYVFSNLVIKFDLKDEDKPDNEKFKRMFIKLVDIFFRLDAKDDNQELISRIRNMIDQPDAEKALEAEHLAMKLKYPLIDDVSELLAPMLQAKDTQGLLRFIRTLNKRELTHQLNNERYQGLLSNILDYVAHAEAKDSDATQVIPALVEAKSEKSKVDFNKAMQSKQTWLEMAWKNKQFNNVVQMIEAGAIVTTNFSEPNESFVNIFLKEVAANPTCLKDKAHLDILNLCLTKTPNTVTDWLKKLSTQICSAVVDMDIPEVLLKQIGVFAINADRFDLLKIINAKYKKATGKAVWARDNYVIPGSQWYYDVGSHIHPAFDSAFRTMLRIPNDDYSSYLECEGFFEAANLIYIYYRDYSRIMYFHDFLEIGLKTKNEEVCYIDNARKYFDGFLNLNNSNWTSVEYKTHPAVMFKNALSKHPNKLSIQEIIRLVAQLLSLQKDVKPGFPVENFLSAIFEKQDPHTWHTHLNKLLDASRSFEIAGYDINVVKEMFKKRKPNFDDVIGSGSIDYFFKVYARVKTNLIESKGESKDSDILDKFHQFTPGKRNEDNDVEFFTALCKACKKTLGREPYHAQLVTVMGAVYYFLKTGDAKLLMDVYSGGGKTTIIAMTALALLKLRPKTTFMPILTMTTNLAEDNANETAPLFKFFGYESGNKVTDEKAIIRYCTSRQLLFKFVDDDVAQASADEVKQVDKSNWILLMDETDVDLLFRLYISDHINALGLYFKDAEKDNINGVLKIIWDNIKDCHNQQSKLLAQVKDSVFYKALPSDLQNHFTKYFASFCWKAKMKWDQMPAIQAKEEEESKKEHKKENKDGAISTYEGFTGVTSANTYGSFAEPQFHQLALKDGKINTSYGLCHYTMPYSYVFDQFPVRVGWSGTLGGEDAFKAYNGYTIAMTARFNGAKLVEPPPILCETEEEWKATLRAKASQFLQQGRPVITFDKTPADVEKLKTEFKDIPGCSKLQTMTGDEKHQEYENIVKSATDAGSLTAATIIGGRGVDYQCNDPEIDKKGGLVVMIATPVEQENVDQQMANRTARGSKNGEAVRIFKRADLVALFDKAGIVYDPKFTAKDLTGKDNLIEKARAAILKNQIKDFKEKKYLTSKLSHRFYLEVLPKIPKKETREWYYRRFVFFYLDAEYAKESEHQDYEDDFDRQFPVKTAGA